jgi:hypothetical protein
MPFAGHWSRSSKFISITSIGHAMAGPREKLGSLIELQTCNLIQFSLCCVFNEIGKKLWMPLYSTDY